MQLRLSKARMVVTIVFIAAGLVVGALGLSPAIAGQPNRSQEPPPSYPVNENGMSYGSASDATSPLNEPDLIKAIGVDGTRGFVRAVDLWEKMPRSPEEALARQQQRAGKVRTVPLYAIDGVTIIGSFNVGPGVAVEHSR
ncbi:MAG: peptidase M56 BlaR1 [Chloroflexota bacterium]